MTDRVELVELAPQPVAVVKVGSRPERFPDSSALHTGSCGCWGSSITFCAVSRASAAHARSATQEGPDAVPAQWDLRLFAAAVGGCILLVGSDEPPHERLC
jgi:hypothetical protein